MANTYKNIVITPNTGSTTGDPTIVFSGGDSNTNTDIILRVYPTSNGTLSFEGNAGQLFSITNDLSNTIFSVNDVSGIPLLEINVASQQITLGQFYGNVGIGTNASNVNNYKLDVIGGANISLPNLTVGGTNVSAAIAAANANAATLSANVNVLAAAVVANDASQGANIATLAASFVSNSQTLSANVNTLAATFASANANTVSLSTNVNVLAAAFVSNSQSLSANVNTFAATFASANANTVSLSTNVNVLAAAFVSNSQSLSANVNTLAGTFVTSNANTISLSTNVNVLAANVNTLAGAAYAKTGGTISGDVTVTGNLTVSGATTYVNTQTLLIGDNLVTLNADLPGNVQPTENAGLEINRGARTSNAAFIWNENANSWQFTSNTLAGVYSIIASQTDANNVGASANNFAAATYLTQSAFASANANTVSLSANVNVLAASFVSNTQTLSANVNTLAATFVSANANTISLSTNVNVLAASFVSNSQSLSANVNTLAGSFVSNSQSLSANVNVLAATFASANANNISLSANVNVLAAVAAAALANTSGVSFNGNLNFPTGNVTIGSSTFSKEIRVLSLVSDTSDYPTSGRGIFYITGANSTTSSNTSIVFSAYDTTSVGRHGAAIQMGKDGAWTGGSGVYPGFMSFWTRESGGTNTEVERMRITAAGNIGIGTTSPAYKLDVNGTTHSTDVYTDSTFTAGNFATTGTNGTLRITTASGASYIQSGLALTSGSAAPLVFSNIFATSEWARFNSSGNFGIGTTNPDAKLHVLGGAIMPAVGSTSSSGIQWPSDPGGGAGDSAFIRYYAVSGESTKFVIGTDNDADDTIALYQQGADRLTVYNGNIGIGTSSPSVLLELGGQATPQVRLLSTTNAVDTRLLSIGAGNAGIVGTYSNHDLSIYANAAERMRITSGGNVGIGTTSPRGKLDVYRHVTHTHEWASKAYTGGTWYRFLTLNATNQGQELRVVLRNPNGHDSVEITIAKHTTGAGNAGVVASIRRLGSYAYTHNITKIRICDDGTNSTTHLEVQFGANHTSTLNMGLIGLINEAFTVVDMTTGAVGSSSTKELFVSDGVSATTNQTMIGYSTLSNDLMYLNTNGNLGIGTTSPGHKLSIGAQTGGTSTATPDTISIGSTYSSAAGTNAKLRLFWDGAITYGFGVSSSQLDYIVSGAYSHVWYSNGSERMRIDGSGLVGIGNTSPGHKLSVNGTAYFTGKITSAVADATDGLDLVSFNAHANMRVIRNAGGGTSDGMYIGYGNAGSATTKIYGGGAVSAALEKFSDYTLEPGSFRSPIFYDSNNTTYYVDPAGLTNIDRMQINSANTGVVLSVGDSGLDNGSNYGMVNLTRAADTVRAHLAFVRSGNYVWQTGYLSGTNSLGFFPFNFSGSQGTPALYMTTGSIVYAPTEFRTPIIYDNNNTNYYFDGASTSVMNRIQFDQLNVAAPTTNQAVGSRLTLYPTGGTGHFSIGIEGGHMWFNTYSGYKWYVTETNWATLNADYFQHNSDIRAPIFYNSGDTNVRWSTNDFVLRGGSPTIWFRDTDHNSAMIHCNSNLLYILRGGTDTETWSQVNGVWPFYLDLTNNNAVFGGGVYTAGSMYASRFYDYDNTAYYVDAAGTSILNKVTLSNGSSGVLNGLDDYHQIILRGYPSNATTGITATDVTSFSEYGGDFRFYRKNGSSLDLLTEINTDYLSHYSDIRSPIFYDSNNTAYYVDPAGTSVFNAISMYGHITGRTDTAANTSVANDTGSMSIRGSTTAPATVSFHRAGAYAINMGLDTDNIFRIGGWTDGVNTYRLQLGTPGGTHTFNGNVTLTGALTVQTGGGTITGGFIVAPGNLGTISSGTTTLSPTTGNYQYYTNGGAHTIAAPGSDCAIDILVTNSATAGAITLSGFTAPSGGGGDSYATTNANRYILSVRRINAISTYVWKALQ